MSHTDVARTVTDPAIAAVDSLARELNMPKEHVTRVYREEAARIGAEARIKTFIGVIVTSRVRAQLRRQQLSR